MRTTRARVWTHVVVVVGFGAVAAAVALGSSLAQKDEPAPTGEILLANATNAVPGSYVVGLKRSTVPSAQVGSTATSLASRFGGTVGFTYTAAARGFSVTMSPEQAKKLASHPSVAYVQQNLTYRASDSQPDPPSWGLSRIDQRDLPTDAVYRYPNTAAGVHAYVIDTGVRVSHTDFGGRASHGWDFIDNDADASDCHGHGTHVAGTIAGSAYGVAKAARVHGVRVLGCDGSGSTAAVLAGINWVTQNAVRPAVANMSLGFSGTDPAVDEAVTDSVAAGIAYVVAAGNESAEACGSSPARVPTAVTVGATTDTDARASFSNYGSCVDIFAPGAEIPSLGIDSDTARKELSGTSMAAPHVAGAVALILEASPAATPADVTRTLLAAAASGKVTGPGAGSPNRLLQVGAGPEPGTGTSPAPGPSSGTGIGGPGPGPRCTPGASVGIGGQLPCVGDPSGR